MSRKTYWQQFHRQRITRRRMLAATGVGAAGLAVVAACGGGGDDDNGDGLTPEGGTAPSAGAPVRGGVYTRAIAIAWGTVNPLTSVSAGPGILARMYNGLVLQSSRMTSEFHMDLAENMEQPDEQTYLFTIRPGVKIAPNSLGIEERDMDATDCETWLQAILDSDTAVHKRFTDVWLDTFSATSPQEFMVTTKGPYAYFFFTLNVPLGGMIPPKEFFEQQIDMNAQGVGAGPLVLTEFEETGGATLEANPNYYRTDEKNDNAQLPYVARHEVSRIDDRAPRRTAFASRQILAYDPETQAEVDDLVSEFPDLEVFEDPAFTFIGFTMNPTKAPWDDARVRRAANMAMNRQEFVDVIVGGAGQPNGLVHWPLGDYALPPEELADLQPFDPDAARALLEEAGHDIPLRVPVIFPANSDIQFHNKHLPIWKRQMEAAGFEIQEEGLEFTNWLTRYQELEYDASLSLNQIYETPEPNLDFHQSQGPTSDGNFAIGIGELFPEVDEAIEASKSMIIGPEQIEAVKATQRLIYERVPAFLPIMSWTDFVVRHSSVKNWPRGLGTGYELYQNDWWVE